MSTDAYRSGPTLYELNGKTALSLAELSELYKVPDYEILRDGTPLPIAFGQPPLTFFVRPPRGLSIYRINRELHHELSKPRVDIDSAKIRSLLKAKKPSLAYRIDYLAISPHDCQSLFNHGAVDISAFETACGFNNLNQLVPLKDNPRTSEVHDVFAIGALHCDTDGVATSFRPEEYTFLKKDVFCLVALLNGKYSLQDLYERKYSGSDDPTATSLKKELFWLHKYFKTDYRKEEAIDTSNKPSFTTSCTSDTPDESPSNDSSVIDIILHQETTNETLTQQTDDPTCDSLSPTLPERIIEIVNGGDDNATEVGSHAKTAGSEHCSSESACGEIVNKHLEYASDDLKTLLRVAENIWQQREDEDGHTNNVLYLTINEAASKIFQQFEINRKAELPLRYAKHLASLIMPDGASKSKVIEAKIDLKNEYISSGLLALFRVSTAFYKNTNDQIKPELPMIELELETKHKLPTYKAEVGARIIRNILSAAYLKTNSLP